MSATMTDAERLRRAILLDPSDDLTRLAYADALEEEGHSERAAYVRKEVRVGRGHRYDYDLWDGSSRWRRDRKDAGRMGDWLLAGFPLCKEPLAPAAPLDWENMGGYGVEATVRRGLVEAACLPPGLWADDDAVRQLFSRHPVVRARVKGRSPHRVVWHDGGIVGYAWFLRFDRGRQAATAEYWSVGAAMLPEWLWRLLPGPEVVWRLLPGPEVGWDFHGVSALHKLYRDHDAALKAVSALLVARGRALAGLPPLPPG